MIQSPALSERTLTNCAAWQMKPFMFIGTLREFLFNGILLGWDEKDDISFNVAEARLTHTDRLNDDSRTMKFKILDRKDYVEEKRKRYKITSNNGFRNRVIRRIPKIR